MLPIVHHRAFTVPLPERHRFPMNKFARLIEVLLEDGIAKGEALHTPIEAPRSWIELAHRSDYVEKVFGNSLPPDMVRRIGLPMSDEVVRRSRLASAGTVLTAKLALEHGLACNTAGGSHHASADGGAGFCVFNDVAVAVQVLRAEGLVHRTLIVDLDVHQGDGTARIFQDDPQVFTFSMHCDKNFPVRKAVSDLDVTLAEGTGDEAYMETLSKTLPNLIESFRPGLIFYNAGVDPHLDDRLGKLALSDEGLKRRDSFVLAFAREAGVPVAAVIGGGYADDVDALAKRHAILHHTASEIFGT